MNDASITIDYDKILEIAQKGVRRASIFMGLGVNAATDETFNSYQLSHITNIQLVPDDLDPDTVAHFKAEFRTWIEAAGLRELVEAFAVYLDALHWSCLLAQSAQRTDGHKDIKQKQAAFAKQGLPNKMNNLAQNFGVGPEHTEYLNSIGRARNCLAHRRGVVGAEDVREDKEMQVQWIGTDLFIETPEGERHYINEMPETGVYLRDGGNVMMQFIERTRVFSLGTVVNFSTRDLAEICFFYQREAKAVLASAVEYAERMGVPVQNADH